MLFGGDEGHPFIIREYDWISTRWAPEPLVINGVFYFAPYKWPKNLNQWGILPGQQKPLPFMDTSQLVGGFNPFEKYYSDWIISPRIRGEHKKCLSCHHLDIYSLHDKYLGFAFV